MLAKAPLEELHNALLTAQSLVKGLGEEGRPVRFVLDELLNARERLEDVLSEAAERAGPAAVVPALAVPEQAKQPRSKAKRADGKAKRPVAALALPEAA